MAFEFRDEDLVEAKRVNRLLAAMPRLQLLTLRDVAFINGALRLSQIFPSWLSSDVRLEERVIDAFGHSARVRILRPDRPCKGLYLDIHGGAWVLGNARMDDKLNAAIARECGFAVISVDYRLAPHNPIRAILDDCETAAIWLMEHGMEEFGADTLFIGGESAGAHLAASTLLRLRDRGRRIDKIGGVVLFYGPYDLAGSQSLREAGPDTLMLHGPTLMASLDVLMLGMSEEERRHPELSPLYADLKGLPPALLMVGSLDPLLDDSVMLADRWGAANGNVELVIAPEAPHAFNRLPTQLARKANSFMHVWLTWQLTARRQPAPIRLRARPKAGAAAEEQAGTPAPPPRRKVRVAARA